MFSRFPLEAFVKFRRVIGFALTFFVFGLTLSPVSAHSQNIISTVVGGGATPTTPLTTDIPGPTAAVRDKSGNTYIAAPLSRNVFELTSGGTLSTFAGLGYGGFSGDGATAERTFLSLSGYKFLAQLVTGRGKRSTRTRPLLF